MKAVKYKNIDPFELKAHYKFVVYLGNEDATEGKEVCTIHLIESLDSTEAYLEIKDEQNIPIELTIGLRDTEQLLLFLKDRILPSNRMFLRERMMEARLDPNDWIGRLRLNKGMVYGDDYYIEVKDDIDEESNTNKNEMEA